MIFLLFLKKINDGEIQKIYGIIRKKFISLRNLRSNKFKFVFGSFAKFIDFEVIWKLMTRIFINFVGLEWGLSGILILKGNIACFLIGCKLI